MSDQTLKEIELILYEGISYAKALSAKRKSNEHIETSKELMKLLLRGVHLVQYYKKEGRPIEGLSDIALKYLLH